jgi:hypothetical protein
VNDENIAYTEVEAYTRRLPLLRSGRDRSSFRPAKLALTDLLLRSTAPCASLPSALPLPPLRRRGVSTILWAGVLHGSGPQLGRTQMAKSAAKPASIPSYEEELEKLSAELKAAEVERAQLEAQWRQKYMPDVEELIEFARRRKHPWAQRIGPENEGIVKETFLVWLYRSTSEQRKIRALENDIDGLKLRIRKAKKMLGLLKGQ